MEGRKFLLSINSAKIKFGLERTEALLKECSNPEKNLLSVQIVGTNGKGSTSAMMAQSLTKLNFKVIIGYFFLLGFFLAGGNILQQISLIYTDVANSAVFTVLYVVIVPIIAYFMFSKKIHKTVWPSVLMCLIGGLLLSELNNLRVRYGDTLVVIGAFFWAFHIVFISKFNINFSYIFATYLVFGRVL